MARDLNEATLKQAGEDYAGQFLLPTVQNPHNPAFAPIGGRGWVMNSLYNLHFKDEFSCLVDEIRGNLGPKALAKFDEESANRFKPRSDDEFHRQLEERLALNPKGKRIPGKVGLVKTGSVIIGWRSKTHKWERDPLTGKKIRIPLARALPRTVRADVQIGETEEEAAFRVTKLLQDHGEIVFPLAQMPAVMALNTRISNEGAIGMCDFIVDRLDEGSGAAVIQGRTGTQPADPDTAVTGTLLFTLVCSDPAFGGASDANPGGRATASAVSSDTSADATNTLSYLRASATNDGATPLDDHIDGEAGTSGADFTFNTLAIVSGATVALTSWTVTQPES